LLRTLRDEAPERVLDLGCGYGALGLALKAANPSLELHMVDRDALAVRYAMVNAESNALEPVDVYGSLGYDDVLAKDFDLIAMNIPAKAGSAAIEHFLLDARSFLRDGGKVAAVVIAPLAPQVESMLERPDVEKVLRREASSYVAFHYRYIERGEPPPSAFERGIYTRGSVDFSIEDIEYEMDVAHDIPEFDTLSYSTSLAARLLGGAAHSFFHDIVVSNPGQGHIPVFLAQLADAERIKLFDRDLLGLRISERNLARNGFPEEQIELVHSVDMLELGTPDLVVDLLRPKEPVAALHGRLDQISESVEAGATLVMAGPSTAVTRALSYMEGLRRWALEARVRKKGLSAARLRRVH
jgi:ribosomal protein L11 methylase PrmA